MAEILSSPQGAQPTRTEQLDSKAALALLRALMQPYPSVPWAMPEHQIENVVRLHDARAREDIAFIREIKPACPALEKFSSVMAVVGGTFHGAMRAHSKKREADFTNCGTFDGSGHHMLWHVDNFLKRLPDVALCKQGFAKR